MEYLNLRVADSWGFGRTESYRGSTTDKQDREVLKLKENVKMNNKVRIDNAFNAIQRQIDYGAFEDEADIEKAIDNMFSWGQLHRVRFMGRGKRRGPDGKAVHINADSCLRHENSSYFDVYVHEDTTQTHRVKERMKKKFCPTLHRIEELRDELWKLEWQLKMESRNV